jgi:hypothetical protein
MKFAIKVLFFASCFFPVMAHAQGSTGAGDGGTGVFCPGGRDDMRSSAWFENRLETLDLYESRRMFQSMPKIDRLQLRDNALDINTQVEICHILRAREFAVQDLEKDFPELRGVFKEACELTSSVTLGDQLPSVKGIGELMWPIEKGCKVVQVAARSGSLVILQRDYAEYLPTTDLAALLLHESLHGIFKFQSSSLAVRQLNLIVFAPKYFRERNLDLAREILRTRQPVAKSRFVLK